MSLWYIVVYPATVVYFQVWDHAWCAGESFCHLDYLPVENQWGWKLFPFFLGNIHDSSMHIGVETCIFAHKSSLYYITRITDHTHTDLHVFSHHRIPLSAHHHRSGRSTWSPGVSARRTEGCPGKSLDHCGFLGWIDGPEGWGWFDGTGTEPIHLEKIWEIPAVEAINQATAYHAAGRCSNDSSMLGIGWGTWTYRPRIPKLGPGASRKCPFPCVPTFMFLLISWVDLSIALSFPCIIGFQYGAKKPRCSALNLTFPHPANSQAEISPQFVD